MTIKEKLDRLLLREMIEIEKYLDDDKMPYDEFVKWGKTV